MGFVERSSCCWPLSTLGFFFFGGIAGGVQRKRRALAWNYLGDLQLGVGACVGVIKYVLYCQYVIRSGGRPKKL